MNTLPTLSTLGYQQVGGLKALLAFAAVCLLFWWWWAERRSHARHWKLRADALLLVGILSLAGWWNFGRFHSGGGFFHFHEFFHYYVGAKYVPELGYTGLYDCAAAIEIDQGRAAEVFALWIRDLRTNELTRGAVNLERAAECKTHFTPDRWAAFTADATWLMDRLSPQKRDDLFNDHGYNPSPLWSAVGGPLAGLAPLSMNQVRWLALLDTVLIVTMLAMIWWGFGWEVLCVALVWWGTNYAARYDYVGGAFLRQDWLLLLVASVCFARRRFMVASGFALTWSALLRIFPGFLAVALLLKIAVDAWKARSLGLTTEQWRFAGGCLLALGILFPFSLTAGGRENSGLSLWRGFIQNSEKHLASPFTNSVGLPTVVAFDPSNRVSELSDYWVDSPWDTWKTAQRRVFTERRWLYWGLVLGFLVLLGAVARGQEDWAALALGVGAIPILSNLSCYYYCVFLCFAFFWPRHRLVGVALAATALISAIIPAVLNADDERFALMSAVFVLFVVVSTALVAWRGRLATDRNTAAPPDNAAAAA